jgi:hypothetical protein
LANGYVPSIESLLTGSLLAFVPSTETPSNKDSDISLLKTERSAQVAAPENVNLAPAPPDKGMTMLQTKEVAVDLESQGHSDRPTLRKRIKEMRQGFKLSPRMISDAIIGISDGMTVPFALTAGLASLGTTRIVIMAGLAELVAGAISMGLGGFIGAKSEAYAPHLYGRIGLPLIGILQGVVPSHGSRDAKDDR